MEFTFPATFGGHRRWR